MFSLIKCQTISAHLNEEGKEGNGQNLTLQEDPGGPTNIWTLVDSSVSQVTYGSVECTSGKLKRSPY